MKFWDSSALVSLLTKDSKSDLEGVQRADTAVAVWWGTRVEGHSALRRRARDGQVKPDELPVWLRSIDRLSSDALEVLVSEPLRALACQLVDRHPLRAADALQLAAAVTLRGDRGVSMDFVCLDQRLRQAAEREGFAVLPV